MVHEVIRVALAARGLVVKHVDTPEVRIVVTAVLAAAADAVLVAHRLQKHGTHLATARHVEEKNWRQEACGRKKAEKEGGGRKRDAAAAGDKQLGSCAAGKMKYIA